MKDSVTKIFNNFISQYYKQYNQSETWNYYFYSFRAIHQNVM